MRFDERAVSYSISWDSSRWWRPWRVTEYPTFCEQRGIWRWREIVVGRAFFAFPPREQQAMLLHEIGHIKMGHIRERIVTLLTRPWRFFRLCREQEYEADRFVLLSGFGVELAQAFTRIKAVSDPLHPPVQERIARLIGA